MDSCFFKTDILWIGRDDKDVYVFYVISDSFGMKYYEGLLSKDLGMTTAKQWWE